MSSLDNILSGGGDHDRQTRIDSAAAVVIGGERRAFGRVQYDKRVQFTVCDDHCDRHVIFLSRIESVKHTRLCAINTIIDGLPIDEFG